MANSHWWLLFIISWASSTGLSAPEGLVPGSAFGRSVPSASAYRSRTGGGGRVKPQFEDTNHTTFIGEPGGSVTFNCNIVMLQDYQVTWSHRPNDGSGDLDLLTLGNTTYTLEPRISASYAHPTNWGLRIQDLKPSDAGTYICQIATFPPRVRVVYLEIQGPMIEIVHDQVVYNAGSHLEVTCIYRNSTGSRVPKRRLISSTTRSDGDGLSSPSSENRLRESDVLQFLEASKFNYVDTEVPKNTIVWLHNGKRFSHRNRRRVKTVRKLDHIESVLSIKSAILEDSGNYSCVLPNTTHLDTVRINVVDGEHSAAIYKNSDVLSASIASSSSYLHSVALLGVFLISVLRVEGQSS